MSDDLDWRLLDRHLAGEATSDDQVALSRWLAADPARDASLRAITSVVRTSDDADWDTRRAWSRVSARLNEPRLSLYLERREAGQRQGPTWLIAAAGAVAAGAVMAIVGLPDHAGRATIGSPAVSRTAPASAPAGRATLRGGAQIDVARDALVFDDVTLDDAATEIGRRFGVRVHVPDPRLAARHVSARFRDAPLPRVLDTISAALGARWTLDGDRVLFEEVH